MAIGKVGMYGGKFLPVHIGHVNMMIKASTMVDELHIIVSYDPEYEHYLCEEKGKIKRIHEDVRVRWWKQLTRDMPHVHVHKVHEKQSGEFEDWKAASDEIKEVVGKPIDVVFSSEPSYDDFITKLYPSAIHHILDSNRSVHNISATKIREEGAFKHWHMIPEVVRPYFNKTVVVVGTEGCGKSTLVKNLANMYNTRYVEEYGRTFYERIGDENSTLPEDYVHIAYEQKFHEKNQLERANKVLFIDTEANVTQYYSHLYLQLDNPVVSAVADDQQYDLWLFLEPDVEWVDDGYRKHGDPEIRKVNNDYLKSMLDDRGIRYESISGNFQDRLEQAINHVDNLLREG